MNRREFLKTATAAGLLSLNGCATVLGRQQSSAHVVIVGGGFAGATTAHYLRQYSPSIKISLIEPKQSYTACPGSNRVLTGLSQLDEFSLSYTALQQKWAINLLATRVETIDSDRKTLRLATGDMIHYDILVLCPGISFLWDSIAGYSEALSRERFPHAWQAGPQTLLLKQQLADLPKGGTLLICPPADPYRCPPGPYERASLIAEWLKQHNPTAKLLILDPKRSFSKQALFEQAWRQHYGYGTEKALIEWHSLADNPIRALDSKTKTVITEFDDRFSGDVINLIPPQTAGQIAIDSGLADASGWCPINPLTSESSVIKDVFVLGDAAHYAPIPKSAFAANSEAKHCAFSISCLLQDQAIPTPTWFNTCYSAVSHDQAISVSNVYRLDSTHKLSMASIIGGVSSRTDPEILRQEAIYAKSAYQNLLADSFAVTT